MTLMTGNVLAQLVSILAAPFLTRLYTPDAFGILAQFVTIVAVLAPGVGGRYEVAVVVANASERRAFFFIAIWIMAFVCLLFLLMLVVAFVAFPSSLNAGALGKWLWLAPIALFLTGVIAALRSWANAVKDYRQLSYVAVVQAASVTFIAIGIGVADRLSDGLLLANVFGLVLTCLYLIYIYFDCFRDYDWRWDQRKWKLALRYKDYPLFNAPTNILNGLMTGVPVFFLAQNFPEAVVGYYALMVRVGVAPLSFIAAAVSEVNVKKIAEMLQTGQNPMPYLRRVTLYLLAVALPPTVLLISSAPPLFSWVFGETWRQAGVLLAILMPALAVKFVVSPLSLSFVAAGHLRLQAAWQVTSLLVTLAVFTWAVRTVDIEGFFWAYMIKDVILYGLYFAMLIFALRNPVRISRDE
jgi:O-antigen/teichoic acid export membrane protein